MNNPANLTLEKNKLDGILLFYKPRGITSFQALGNIKRTLGTPKVGHTGTLDKFAEGLLIILTGKFTRFNSLITGMDKTYEGLVHFGEETDTLDPEGTVIRTAALPSPKDFEEAVKKFSGSLMQRPPVYSAIHTGGKRASDIARSGQNPVLAERPVTVHRAEILTSRLSEDGNVLYAQLLFCVSVLFPPLGRKPQYLFFVALSACLRLKTSLWISIPHLSNGQISRLCYQYLSTADW